MALNRIFTALDHGLIRPMSPGGVPGDVGCVQLQFNPSIDFQGSFGVMGKTQGVPEAQAPYQSVPYYRVTVAGTAADYALVSDLVIPSAIIIVPANGLAIGLFVNCTVGSCQVTGWDLNGTAAV
jgi:hypothetical protein